MFFILSWFWLFHNFNNCILFLDFSARKSVVSVVALEWISPRRVEISLMGNKKTNKWSWESLFMCYPSCLSIFLRWFTIFLSFKVTRNYCLDLCAISSVNAIFGDFKHFVMLQRIIWVTRFQMVLLLIEDRKSCLKTTLSEFCYDSNPSTLSILLALAFSMMSAC